MIVSLIANTSIQYYKFKIPLLECNPQFFRESLENGNFVYEPILKYKADGQDYFIKRKQLIEDEVLVVGSIGVNNIDVDSYVSYPENTIKKYSDLLNAIDKLKERWIPLPVFIDNSINVGRVYPTDWVRCYIEYDESKEEANITIAVDTSTTEDEDNKTSPFLSYNNNDNIHSLCTEPSYISDFLYKTNDSLWIEEYIAQEFFKKEAQQFQTPFLRHIASYILIIEWLNKSGEFPKIQLFNEKVDKISVDLVVDIGNSSTCALLYEKNLTSNFDFNRIKKLNIQDYTNPKYQYSEPFSMNLIFNNSNFGNLNNVKYFNKKFVLPSIVRVGEEAKKLINKEAFNLEYGYELRISNSSPKRYLWDNTLPQLEWQFKPNEGILNNVSLPGITNQLKNNGEIKDPGSAPSSKALYTRKSLMKFAFLEILTHAYIQINSYEYRKEQGNMITPRTIDKIVLSCPTSMSKQEQIELRRSAEQACELLNSYFAYNSDGKKENKIWVRNPEVIPSSKEISLNYSQIEDRLNWNYDEATCSQIVFLYTLLNRKINNNFIYDNYILKNKDYFSVGSIDFGAGTTDVVINQVSIKYNKHIAQNTIKLKPLFSDSFKTAGDDLLKVIIHKLFLESGNNDSVIEKLAISNNITNYSNRIRSFFGPNADNIGFHAKINRKSFVNQVCIPFALKCLQHANEREIVKLNISQIIGIEKDSFENLNIFEQFEKHFGFEFKDIELEIDPVKVNECINHVFNPLISLIAEIFNFYNCDFIVLSGKPASLNTLEKIVKTFSVNYSNTIININNYWLGNWYPFSDENGMLKDSKTVVTMGAMISFLSEKYNLIKDFNVDTSDLLKHKFSNADYVFYEQNGVKKEILTPKKNQNDLLVSSLPFSLKVAKNMSLNYPASILYAIDINKKAIEDFIIKRKSNLDSISFSIEIDNIITSIYSKLPLKINIEREYSEDKEKIIINSIENREGDTINNEFIKLKIQTLDQSSYWLDTCEFNF